MIIRHLVKLITIFGVLVTPISFANERDPFLTFAKEKVERAIKSNQIWRGPTQGPELINNKKIIFIASDLRNGGAYGVAKGISEAISNIDWHLKFIDGRGSKTRQKAAIKKAIGFKPDAIVLGGIDAFSHKEALIQAKKLGIIIIGWHATERASANNDLGLYMNITTDPLDVAEVAALFAVVESNGKAKVVIFNDPNYKIASIKAIAMRNTIKRCRECEVLEIKPISLDEIAQKTPEAFKYLWQKYDEKITHILTINDLYIDYAIPFLESRLEEGKKIPNHMSAGDGSEAAYKRINQNNFQLATVPEPLYLHGWQIIDELNRAFNQQPPSGYSAPVHLVTSNNVDELMQQKDTAIYDPQNGYRKIYLNIWKGL